MEPRVNRNPDLGTLTIATLQMICTHDGYAITDEHGTSFATFSVAAGQSIYLDAYRDPRLPDVTSIFLRGVLSAYGALRQD